MDAFIDSNLLAKVIFPNKKNISERRQVKLILRQFNIQHNIVSLVESARNYRLKDYKRNILHQLIGLNPIIPNKDDWRLSHYILLQWVQLKKMRDKQRIRKMQMDCLLAGMAINRNVYVVTHDKDFKDLKNTEKGRHLLLFSP
jgi:predicted nucleic acid-binding protein